MFGMQIFGNANWILGSSLYKQLEILIIKKGVQFGGTIKHKPLMFIHIRGLKCSPTQTRTGI